MMETRMDGLSYWLRQRGDLVPPTYDTALAWMKEQGGSSTLLHKVADGKTWQGAIDPATPVYSLAAVKAVRATLRDISNVTMVPVVNPRGIREGEAQFHAAIAQQEGILVVDLEPYPGFWDTSPTSLIPTYCAELRRDAPDAYLVLQGDPRRFEDTVGLSLAEVAPAFDAFANQHYVGDTTTQWTDVEAEIDRFYRIKEAALLHNPFLDFYATLWGLGNTNLAVRFGHAIAPECYGFNVFALAAYQMMSKWQLNAFRDAGFNFKQRTEAPPVVIPRPEEAALLGEMHRWASRDIIGATMRRDSVEARMRALDLVIPTYGPGELEAA